MKANVQYDDFIGTAAADSSDLIDVHYGRQLEGYSKYFNINSERFIVVGLSLYGTDTFSLSFLCVDLERSTNEKEFIVKMSIGISDQENNPILSILFKRLEFVLYSKFDNKYSILEYDQECNYEDYHEIIDEDQEN